MCSKLDRSNKLSNKTNHVMCNKISVTNNNKLQTRNQAMCNKFENLTIFLGAYSIYVLFLLGMRLSLEEKKSDH